MAEVLHLRDLAMENSVNEEFYSIAVRNKMQANNYSYFHENWVTDVSKIKLEIKKPEKSAHLFKKVIVLTTIVVKFKGGRRCNYQCFFYDDDLLPRVPVNENVTSNNVETEEAAKPQFLHRKTSVHKIRVRNTWALKFKGSSLVASPLEGENDQLELKMNVDTYIERDGNNFPVALGIVGHKLYLYCNTEEGMTSPALRLMEVDDIKEKQENDLLPFIFYCRKIPDSLYSSFESAAISGNYISTSQNEDEELQLKPENDQFYLREFILTKV